MTIRCKGGIVMEPTPITSDYYDEDVVAAANKLKEAILEYNNSDLSGKIDDEFLMGYIECMYDDYDFKPEEITELKLADIKNGYLSLQYFQPYYEDINSHDDEYLFKKEMSEDLFNTIFKDRDIYMDFKSGLINQCIDSSNDWDFPSSNILYDHTGEMFAIAEHEGLISSDKAKEYLYDHDYKMYEIAKERLTPLTHAVTLKNDDWNLTYFPISNENHEFVDINAKDPFTNAVYKGSDVTAYLNAYAKHNVELVELHGYDESLNKLDYMTNPDIPFHIGTLNISEDTEIKKIFPGITKLDKSKLPKDYVYDLEADINGKWLENEVMFDLKNNTINIYDEFTTPSTDEWRKPKIVIDATNKNPSSFTKKVYPQVIAGHIAAIQGIEESIATEILPKYQLKDYKATKEVVAQQKEAEKLAKKENIIKQQKKIIINVKLKSSQDKQLEL